MLLSPRLVIPQYSSPGGSAASVSTRTSLPHKPVRKPLSCHRVVDFRLASTQASVFTSLVFSTKNVDINNEQQTNEAQSSLSFAEAMGSKGGFITGSVRDG